MPTVAVISFNTNILAPAFNAEDVTPLAVRLQPSTTYQKGTVMAERTDNYGTYDKYVSAGPNGTGVPKGLLMTDCVTDASGNITYGLQAQSEFGETHLTADIYTEGTFRTEDLVGLDAGAVTALGRIIEGTLAGPGLLRLL